MSTLPRLSTFVWAAALAGCAGTVSGEVRPSAVEAGAQSASAPVIYEVTWLPGGLLDVAITAPSGGFGELTIESEGELFVRDLVARGEGGVAVPAELRDARFHLPACDGPCTLSYRFDLEGAARSWQNPQFASKVGGAILAPPTSWLLFPSTPRDEPFELAVTVPSGVGFACGLERRPSGRMGARLSDLPQAPYAVFGDMRLRSVELAGHAIELAIVGDQAALGDARIEAWVRDGAENVAGYFGGLPSAHALVIAIVGPGDGIGHGTALGNGGASIQVHVGVDTSDQAFAHDWIMTHEMIHLTMPGLHVRHTWLEEGLATYLEPIMRRRRGRLEDGDVWREWRRSMWYGLPLEGDAGLDGTERWGRIYWGGATFWLLADVAIRERTGGARSLRDCLRGVAAQEGSIAVRWSVRRLMAVCDAAVGAEIVGPMYEAHAARAVDVDLGGLFDGLGVKRRLRGVVLDDEAPRAALRRAITAEE